MDAQGKLPDDDIQRQMNVMLRQVDKPRAEELIKGIFALLAPHEDGTKTSVETAFAALAAVVTHIIMQGHKTRRLFRANVFDRLVLMNLRGAFLTEAVEHAAGDGSVADLVESKSSTQH